MVKPELGRACFFYRKQRRAKGTKGSVSGWIGPGVVVGLQGNSAVWVAYAGRCYLCSYEHCREAAGDEQCLAEAQARAIVREMQKGEGQEILCEDLTEQGEVPEHLEEDVAMEPDAAEEAAEDQEMDAVADPQEVPAPRSILRELVDLSADTGWQEDGYGRPVRVSWDVDSLPTLHGSRHPPGTFPYRSMGKGERIMETDRSGCRVGKANPT